MLRWKWKWTRFSLQERSPGWSKVESLKWKWMWTTLFLQERSPRWTTKAADCSIFCFAKPQRPVLHFYTFSTSPSSVHYVARSFSKSSSGEICPFAPIFLRFNYFSQNIWRLSSAQFDIYLGTSLTRPCVGERFASESVAIQAGCIKMWHKFVAFNSIFKQSFYRGTIVNLEQWHWNVLVL